MQWIHDTAAQGGMNLISAAAVSLLSLSLACAALSLVVVWRRWAFLGEGIAHAGFGGAGCAWLLACLYPGLDSGGFVMLCVTLFCLATGAGIATLQRHERVHSDTAIGVFLVGALAWGFLAQQLYFAKYQKSPVGFTALLFGHAEILGPLHARVASGVAVLTLVVLTLLRKEVLACCLDASLARVSGVRERLIHYILIFLTTIAIVVGVQVVGSVLITALLILPGATATLLCRRLHAAIALALANGVCGAMLGLLTHGLWPAVPVGPAVVLSLLLFFIIAYLASRMAGMRAQAGDLSD